MTMELFNLFKIKKGTPNSHEIVDQLERLGYFRYTEKNDLEELKMEISSGLKEGHCLSTIYSDKSPYTAKELRHYGLDGEALFEEGGFLDCLMAIKPTFDKMGLELTFSNYVEEWDPENDWLNHRITINGKEYTIFKNFKGVGWAEAAQRFADIINDQLRIQGTDERLYLANGGNDGMAIFLTEKQFELLDPILKNPNERPQRIEVWCKLNMIERMPVLGE